MPDQATVLLVTTGAFLLAGFVKGLIGLGLPTISIGLLGLLMTPMEAAAILALPSFVTNVWQLAAGPPVRPLVSRLSMFLVATCLGVWTGGVLLAGISPNAATAALGAVIILYAAYGLALPPFAVSRRYEPWLSPLMGASTGFGAAVTGVFMMPGVPYLAALGLGRDGFIQALGLFFTVSTAALAGTLASNGHFGAHTIVPTLVALAASLAGMPLGTWMRRRASPDVFRNIFFVGLLLLGSYLTWRSVR